MRPRVPMVTARNGKKYQLVYTDFQEMDRFVRQHKTPGKLQIIPVTYSQLGGLLEKDADGYVFNPAGFNLTLNRKQIALLEKRYREEDEEPAEVQAAEADTGEVKPAAPRNADEETDAALAALQAVRNEETSEQET